MSSPSPVRAAHDEIRRIVSDFFVKSLNIILGARIPSRYLKPKPGAGKDDGSLGLILSSTPLRTRCHLSALEPIVVDVLLLKKSKLKQQLYSDEKQQQQDTGRKRQPEQLSREYDSQSLIERWVVHCVPWSDTEGKKREDSGATSSLPSSPWSPRRKLIKMLAITLRTLYSLTRLLPAFRLFQQLNCSTANFDLSYKLGPPPSNNSSNNSNVDVDAPSFRKYEFVPVETELGRMCISVRYASSVHGPAALERTSSIFSDIIPDYMALPRQPSMNPHYAVMDSRVTSITRTRSNLGRPSSCATARTVRRSRSSGFLNNETEQMICPFAADEERKPHSEGRSRDAAVGALIRALESSSPLKKVGTSAKALEQQQQQHFPPIVHRIHQQQQQQQQEQHHQQQQQRRKTLSHALRELGSYKLGRS